MTTTTRLPYRTLLAASLALLSACSDETSSGPRGNNGRLSARPAAPTSELAPGFHQLQLSNNRDGFIWVPEGYDPAVPAPLLVLLHGGGGRSSAELAQWPLQEVFGRKGVVIVAPDSRGGTWDVIYTGMFSGDILFMNAALQTVFSKVNVDPSKIAIGGFSDGATYALSVGLTNGDLFSRIIAFSPGFIAAASLIGQPQIFDSHGTTDAVLPIGQASRVIVPWLRDRGYTVNYVEFEGGHVIPLSVANQAVDWWLPGD